MKIELKANFDTYQALSMQLTHAYQIGLKAFWYGLNAESKVAFSITYDVSERVNKKYQNLCSKMSLLEHNKKYKISLKYHEAWALLKFLENSPDSSIEYHRNLLQQFYNTLHQKLA